MRVAHARSVAIQVWASTPCNSGCPWRQVNQASGRNTGDEKLSNILIQRAARICKFARVLGGHYTWEWPERCELWQDKRFRALASAAGNFALICASAVDWFAIVRNKEVTVKKILKIWITDDRIAEVFHPYHTDPDSDRKTFVECSNDIAKNSAHYTKQFAELVWRSQCSSSFQSLGICCRPLRVHICFSC